MTREIRNTPHPTPHPDGPHAVSSNRGAGAGSGRPSDNVDESSVDEPNYDSCMDDLNLILSSPVSEPDPVLRSPSSSDAIPRVSHESAAVPTFLQERGKQPRTSEVFQRVGPQTASAGTLPSAAPAESTPEPETVFEGHPIAEYADSNREPLQSESRSDDDHVAESRAPWTLLLLMSYSSALTLALVWVLWTGRSFRFGDSTPSAATAPEPESVPRSAESALVGTLPPLAPENVATLGGTVRLGDLEVTPVEIVSNSLELVRSIEPTKWRRDELPALVLRLKLKNVSANRAFAPLERRFLREQPAAVDRSFLLTSQGDGINMYPLAVDSEWSIVGQEFPSLEPGESVETIIASEVDAEGRLTDETTWRVRLRVGPYRTDVLGVRFHKNEITR